MDNHCPQSPRGRTDAECSGAIVNATHDELEVCQACPRGQALMTSAARSRDRSASIIPPCHDAPQSHTPEAAKAKQVRHEPAETPMACLGKALAGCVKRGTSILSLPPGAPEEVTCISPNPHAIALSDNDLQRLRKAAESTRLPVLVCLAPQELLALVNIAQAKEHSDAR